MTSPAATDHPVPIPMALRLRAPFWSPAVPRGAAPAWPPPANYFGFPAGLLASPNTGRTPAAATPSSPLRPAAQYG
eukprot:scaffold2450_cov128-Isochrysis_galbana.AAC.7